MPEKLPRVPVHLKTGHKPFHAGGCAIGPKLKLLCDYWRWSNSDLLSNTQRGVLAEYLVATALGLDDKPRDEWAAWDMKMCSGKTIEVKSSAYIQSWSQCCFTEIDFDIAPRKWGFDADTGETTIANPPRRFADVYVFCLLKHKDQGTVDPLNVDQWEFYVLSADCLNKECCDQRQIGLRRLCKLAGGALPYADLRGAVESAAGSAYR